MGRKGGPCLLEPADGPRVLPLPTVSRPHCVLSAVCRARYASPTPARVERDRPCYVKAAQAVWGQVGARLLGLDVHGKLSGPAREAGSSAPAICVLRGGVPEDGFEGIQGVLSQFTSRRYSCFN